MNKTRRIPASLLALVLLSIAVMSGSAQQDANRPANQGQAEGQGQGQAGAQGMPAERADGDPPPACAPGTSSNHRRYPLGVGDQCRRAPAVTAFTGQVGAL